MNVKRVIFISLILVLHLPLFAQLNTINATVVDAETNKPLPFTTIINHDDYLQVISTENGFFSIHVSSDSLAISISRLGYKTLKLHAKSIKDTIKLQQDSYKLKQVDVTGTESNELQNTTILDQTALSYLQPAGLKDAFQLLPGNLTENPDLSEFNQPLVREIDYNETSSLGTALIIDGNAVSSNSSMQHVTTIHPYIQSIAKTRMMFPFGKGNDLRAVSMDNIESIKIIKGIPSVQYGDLTSAVIDIKSNVYSLKTGSKLKYSPNLFSVGASTGSLICNKHSIGGNISYTSSNRDERASLSYFNRLNAAFGSRHQINTNSFIKTKLSAYSTVNKFQHDADLLSGQEYIYNDNSGIKSSFTYSYYNSSALFNQFDVALQANADKELLRVQEYSPSGEVQAFIYTQETGEHFGTFQASEMLSKYSIKGNPFSLNLKSKLQTNKSLFSLNSGTLMGIDAAFEKNYGQGLEFDRANPPMASSITFRKQKFSDIPALFRSAVYLEEKLNKTVNLHKFELQAGIRYTVYTPDKASLKWFWEPRINALYSLELNKSTTLSIHGGWGLQYKIPPMRYLHPDDAWFDMVSYNAYNTVDPENSFIVFSTSKYSTRNAHLKPFKSSKAEVGLSIDHTYFWAIVTAFSEKHSDGILLTQNYVNTVYRKYDTESTIDHESLPGEQNIPFVKTSYYNHYLFPDNGRFTLKEGIEYSVKSTKINPLQTQIFLSGAWFRTKTIQDQERYYFLPFSNTSEQNDFIGIYQGGYGKLSERLSSNLQFITHIPKVSLVFSVSFQTIWLYTYKFLRERQFPLQLIDRNGSIQDFTIEMQNDPAFATYIKTASETHYEKENFPSTTQINMKLSKELWQDFKVSFFANNIFNNRPLIKQKISNTFIRMNTPLYFGLDLIIKF